MSSIHETLAQLDDRLDELRREVARLTEQPVTPAGEQPPGNGHGFSVARLAERPGQGHEVPAPGAHPAPEARPAPEAPAGAYPAQEIHELLAACGRLLAEARELISAHGADQARPAFFEGTVTLVALGANLLQTIQVLEDSLTRARHVTRAYIRRVQAGEVRVELTLTGGVDLVGELNRVMPFPFAVRSATQREIVVSLEGGAVDL